MRRVTCAGCVARAIRHHTPSRTLPALARGTCDRHRPRTRWYVGDDIRDIQAAHAARMKGIVARYGYLGGSDPRTWNVDLMIDSAGDLVAMLELVVPVSVPNRAASYSA